jgi:HSP20 family protein
MLTRWEPTTELATLSGAMDRMFREFFAPTWANGSGTAVYQLPVDVSETEDGYRLRATLPGFKPEQVEVTVSDGVLSIDAKRSEEKTEENGRYLRREVFSGNYRRQLTLPGNVKAEDIKAEFDNGVLTVQVPRAPKPQPVKVAIGSGPAASDSGSK